MSKKQKRSVAAPVAVTTAPTNGGRSAATRTAVTQEFNPDYTPVIKDLKKIAIMAVSFISLLVVLSFFLR